MNSIYIHEVAAKANELIHLIECAAPSPEMDNDKVAEWKPLQKLAVEKAKDSVRWALTAEALV